MERIMEIVQSAKLDDTWPKIIALLMYKMAAGKVEFTAEDIISLGDDKAIAIWEQDDRLFIELITRDRARKMLNGRGN
jgi:hypothetical protein